MNQYDKKGNKYDREAKMQIRYMSEFLRILRHNFFYTVKVRNAALFNGFYALNISNFCTVS